MLPCLFLPDVRVAAKDRRTGQARMMHDGCLQLRIGNGKQGGQAGGRGQSTVKAPPAFSAPPMAMSNRLDQTTAAATYTYLLVCTYIRIYTVCIYVLWSHLLKQSDD